MERARGQDQNCWYGVQDPRKRKQIQNRLAQRARRQRLSGARKSSEHTDVVRGRQDDSSLIAPNTPNPTEGTDASPSRSLVATTITPSFGLSSSAPSSTVSTLSCDHFFLNDPKMSAIMALTINGSILGLSCNDSRITKSPPQPPSVPQSLHPTPIQLSTAHYDWIDRLPFPLMRDNMIILMDVVDAKELLVDFFTMRSFTVRAGAASWDASAWEISPEFKDKWGYLFY